MEIKGIKKLLTLGLCICWHWCFSQYSLYELKRFGSGVKYSDGCIDQQGLVQAQKSSDTVLDASQALLLILPRLNESTQIFRDHKGKRPSLKKQLIKKENFNSCVNFYSSNQLKNIDFLEIWTIFDFEDSTKVKEKLFIKYMTSPSGKIRILAERFEYIESVSLDRSSTGLTTNSVFRTVYFMLDFNSIEEIKDQNLEFQIFSQGYEVGSMRYGEWMFFFRDGKVGRTILYLNGKIQSTTCYSYQHLQGAERSVERMLGTKVVYNNKFLVRYDQFGGRIKREKLKRSLNNHLPSCQCDLY